MAERADVLAALEIVSRYEETETVGVDEVATRRMAVARVITPIADAAIDQELVLYLSWTSPTEDGQSNKVLAAHAAEAFVPGTRFIGGIVEDAADTYELTGSELLIAPSGETSVVGFTAGCLTTEEQALSEQVDGRSLASIIEELELESREPSPSTEPEATLTEPTTDTSGS